MPHNHVTVTVESETVRRIEERLDPGETVAHWMRDATEMRLDGAVGEGPDAGGGDAGDDPERNADHADDPTQDTDAPGRGDDLDRRRPDRDVDDRGPAYEFVDDCAI